MAELKLDDLDHAIIRELEQDGRRAFREIARTVDTSEATVRARVTRLPEAGEVPFPVEVQHVVEYYAVRL